MTTSPEDEPIPLFLGRQDGTVEKFISITDADLGRPSLVLRGHTKAVTGIAAVSADDVYSCSMDGTVKRWNADVEFDGRRVLRSIDTKTPLRCMHLSTEGRVYVGGDNGGFTVIDGERRSSFTGHSGAITAITVTMDGLVVTGGMDNQIRVWDISSGNTIRLLMGHQNFIKCLVVVEDDEEDQDGDDLEDSRGLILSFSLDRTMKVWRIPNPQDVQEEVPIPLGEERKSTVVSFKEPAKDEEEKDSTGVKTTTTENSGNANPSSLPSDTNAATEVAATAVEAREKTGEVVREGKANAGKGEGGAHDPLREVFGGPERRVSPPLKSAIKIREKPAIRRDEVLGTIELPEAPYCTFREEGLSTIYVGTTQGYIYGLQAKQIAATVLRFTSRNKGMVKKDVREMKQIVKQSIAMYKKECRKLVKAEEKKHLRVARRENRERKKKEREEKQKEREGMSAARRTRQREIGDGDEEEEEEEEGDFEEEENQEEEEEEEEEDPLHILSAEKREELKKFVEEKEKERDKKIKDLEDACFAHLRKVEPKGENTYDRKREEFHRLHWTTYTKAGKETMLALTAANGKVYAAQGDRVLPTVVAKGVTALR